MDHGDILSGAAFRAVLRSAVVFLVVLTAMAGFSVRLIETMGKDAVREHVIEFRDGLLAGSGAMGRAVLSERVRRWSDGPAGRTHVLALYDPGGARLAGNVDRPMPDGAWAEAELAADGVEGTRHYLLHGVRLGEMSLTLGRSVEVVELAQNAAIWGFAFTGFAVTLAMLGIGYALSRRSQSKLQVIEATLERVADGEAAARIEVPPDGAEQIDRVARKMNLQLDRLDRLMGATRRTAASVAHDLRRPLARLTLDMERARERVEANEVPREEVERTAAGLHQLTDIVATILRIARIEGGVSGQMRRMALRDVLDEVAETFAPVAEDAGGALDYARPEAPLVMRGDPEMIAQLVVNLVQNALSHGRPGGRVSLEAEAGAERMTLCVADDGDGIPEAAREAVFAPFFRADRARTIEGSGLGLSLVKAIADRHSAEIRLSDATPGLRVEVAFPRA